MTEAEGIKSQSKNVESNALKADRLRRQNDAFLLSIIVVAIIGAALVLAFASDLASFSSGRYGESRVLEIADRTVTIRIVAAFIAIAVLGLVTYLFASGSPILRARTFDTSASNVRVLEAAIDEINQAAKTIAANRFIPDGDRKLIVTELKTLVQESLPTEFLEKIDAKYGNAIINQKISKYFEDSLDVTKGRLQSFQKDLSLKAASSLAWGIITAILGLATLFVFIIYPPDGSWSDVKSIFHIAARLGVVAMIEVVAFFFLNQYKFTLLDLKYVSNEVTNTEMRMLSLIAAAKLGDKAALGKTLAELAKTERNFALKKGEVSIFHSGSGSDLLQHVVMADILKQLIPKRGKGSVAD